MIPTDCFCCVYQVNGITMLYDIMPFTNPSLLLLSSILFDKHFLIFSLLFSLFDITEAQCTHRHATVVLSSRDHGTTPFQPCGHQGDETASVGMEPSRGTAAMDGRGTNVECANVSRMQFEKPLPPRTQSCD